MASFGDLPKPRFITGGCLCGALRYRVDFPPDHDFLTSSGTCQCTQCRRNTGSLFETGQEIAHSAFRWLPPAGAPAAQQEPQPWSRPPAAFKTYSASPGIRRGFCAHCGGLLAWFADASASLTLMGGTIDPLYLAGEGADGVSEVEGQVVPREGYGLALVGGFGANIWCENEIKGVTDQLPLLGVGRGKRYERGSGP